MREFRIPGVLQRFAGTYLIIATMHMFFARPTDSNQVSMFKLFHNNICRLSFENVEDFPQY